VSFWHKTKIDSQHLLTHTHTHTQTLHYSMLYRLSVSICKLKCQQKQIWKHFATKTKTNTKTTQIWVASFFILIHVLWQFCCWALKFSTMMLMSSSIFVRKFSNAEWGRRKKTESMWDMEGLQYWPMWKTLYHRLTFCLAQVFFIRQINNIFTDFGLWLVLWEGVGGRGDYADKWH